MHETRFKKDGETFVRFHQPADLFNKKDGCQLSPCSSEKLLADCYIFGLKLWHFSHPCLHMNQIVCFLRKCRSLMLN